MRPIHFPKHHQEDDAQKKKEKIPHRSPVKFEEMKPLGFGVGYWRTILILDLGDVLLDWRNRLRLRLALPLSHLERLLNNGRNVKREK